MANVNVFRSGRERTLIVALVPAPEEPPRDTRALAGEGPFAGITVMNLSPAVAEELDVDYDEHGVVIAEIERGAAARRLGLRPGDIIVDVNGNEIDTTRTLEQLNENRAYRWDVILNREGKFRRFSVRG